MAFSLLSKKFLGIDTGTSAIKIVELSSFAGRIKLENYGEVSALAFYQKPFRTFEKNVLLLSSEDIARAIKAVMEEAKIKSQKCIFSIPDYSSFFTTFELPPMTAEELPQAVEAEARMHIPLPLSEVTLDWQLIEGKASDRKREKLKVLLVAVPNEVINQYQRITTLSNLQLLSLEAEVFGLIRSLIPRDEKQVTCIIDIGIQSTTCSIVDKKTLKISRSFDVSGNAFTERIAKGLGVDYKVAEDLKKKYGISPHKLVPEGMNIREILVPLIDLIVREVEKIFKNFYLRERKDIDKIILAGGNALLPGLAEYFQNYFEKEITIANPFSKIFYPPILEQTLKEIGPSYAVVVGLAMRGLE